jgi:WD40 repeat protein
MRKATLFLAPAVSCAAALLVSCASVNFATLPGIPHLYVASGAVANLPQPTLTGYTIAADGALTPVPCAPLAHAQVLALTGARSLLFASAQPSGPASSVISSYTIASNGCLTLKSTTDVTAQGAPLSLFLDHQADTLYSWVWLDSVTSGLRSYSLDVSSGAVKFTGEIYGGYPTYLRSFDATALPASMLAFSPDDSFAVSSSWAPLDITGIYVYQRSADGTLQGADIFANSPAGPAVALFATEGAASDNAGHFIVAGVVCQGYWACPDRPVQLAVYTLDSQRHFTTQSTPKTMATPPSNGYLTGYAFSPDSRYFATATDRGIDVYLWDASSASLQYFNSIPQQGNGFTEQFVQAFTWDRYDHLIFTSAESIDGESPDGQIQVYNITPSGIVPAAGSPYALNSPHLLTVVNVPPPSPF